MRWSFTIFRNFSNIWRTIWRMQLNLKVSVRVLENQGGNPGFPPLVRKSGITFLIFNIFWWHFQCDQNSFQYVQIREEMKNHPVWKIFWFDSPKKYFLENPKVSKIWTLENWGKDPQEQHHNSVSWSSPARLILQKRTFRNILKTYFNTLCALANTLGK